MVACSTNLSGTADANGVFAFRGYHGDYKLTVDSDPQTQIQHTSRLTPDNEVLVVPVAASNSV